MVLLRQQRAVDAVIHASTTISGNFNRRNMAEMMGPPVAIMSAVFTHYLTTHSLVSFEFVRVVLLILF